MERIIVKRGGVKLIAGLMNCDRTTVWTALGATADQNNELHMKIRKCAMNHGGVVLNPGEGKPSYEMDCLEFSPRRVAYRWDNGTTLVINCDEGTATIMRPDQMEEEFEVVGLRMSEIDAFLVYCESARAMAETLMKDVTTVVE